ncbi:uncharacterized protein RHIMIDRAFT_244159 [Rhizopus microsporus ATCC 52813]|uniref:CoA-dependent acyltransferase n=2 Tax=Rhizopus microsporus TaxID=58291 RepID=A0A2G4SSB6_RHIZD|nr:uncharacterized protein RHIMIDRAFT_244159 [Rhizopus microsporus ATCC 52813]PHZ11677.1 hypothetical protein RHIMIDRAFT_244159 [Rhizopus microsporus ATCC 52813]
MTTTRQARPLGLLEKYQLSKHLLNAYGSVVFSAELEHPIREVQEDMKQFYVAWFLPALKKLIEKHSALSLVVRDAYTSNPRLEILNSINLSDVLEISFEDSTIEKLTQEQCSRDFDLNALTPLWQLKVVPLSQSRCLAALALNHIIGDGNSLRVFWMELLEALESHDQGKGVNNQIIQTPEHLEAPLTLESCGLPSPSVLTDALPVLAKGYLESVSHTLLGDTEWRGDFPAVDGEAHNTEIKMNKISREKWKKILAEAKKRQISGHAILQTLHALVWATLYSDSKWTTICMHTPINCRPLCDPPIPQTQMGNFVGSYESQWSLKHLGRAIAVDDDKLVWSMAKKYYDNLQKNKMNSVKLSLLLSYLPEFPTSYCDFWTSKRKYAMKRKGGIEHSDLGKMEWTGTRWRLVSMYFCQSAHTYSCALEIQSICLNGELYYTLSWQKNALDKDKIDAFNRVLDHLVDKIAK